MKPRFHSGFLILACGIPTCAPLLRAQVAGSVDLSYDPVIGASGSFARVTAAMPQPDGKIVVAGAFNQVQGQARHTMARLLPSGVLEPAASFNPDIPGSAIGMKLALQTEGGSGAATAVMEFQASANLTVWSTVTTTRADDTGRARFDYTASGDPREYFRVRLP